MRDMTKCVRDVAEGRWARACLVALAVAKVVCVCVRCVCVTVRSSRSDGAE